MRHDGGRWRSLTNADMETLPPGEREAILHRLQEEQGREPLGWINIEILDWARGQSRIQFSPTPDTALLFDAAIRELQIAKEALGDS